MVDSRAQRNLFSHLNHFLSTPLISQAERLVSILEVVQVERQLTKKKILVRLDSAHDAISTRAELSGDRMLSRLVKRNPRRDFPPGMTARNMPGCHAMMKQERCVL